MHAFKYKMVFINRVNWYSVRKHHVCTISVLQHFFKQRYRTMQFSICIVVIQERKKNLWMWEASDLWTVHDMLWVPPAIVFTVHSPAWKADVFTISAWRKARNNNNWRYWKIIEKTKLLAYKYLKQVDACSRVKRLRSAHTGKLHWCVYTSCISCCMNCRYKGLLTFRKKNLWIPSKVWFSNVRCCKQLKMLAIDCHSLP